MTNDTLGLYGPEDSKYLRAELLRRVRVRMLIEEEGETDGGKEGRWADGV